MFRKFATTVKATGVEGSAAGTGHIEFHSLAKVYAIILDYTSGAATADVTVTDSGETVSSGILAQLNSETDKVYYPRVAANKGADGTASTLTEVCPVAEGFKVEVAQGKTNETVTVTVIVEE